MTSVKKIQNAVDENYRTFVDNLPNLERQYMGKYVLLRDKEVVEAFDSIADAMIFGSAQFPDELFSVQRVPNPVVDLGYFSYAVPVGDI